MLFTSNVWTRCRPSTKVSQCSFHGVFSFGYVDLSSLLQLPQSVFWGHVVYNSSFHRLIDTFLQSQMQRQHFVSLSAGPIRTEPAALKEVL